MKAIERNLARHENGIIYLRVRRGGELKQVSLCTRDIAEAHSLLRKYGIEGLLAGDWKERRSPSVEAAPVGGLRAAPPDGAMPFGPEEMAAMFQAWMEQCFMKQPGAPRPSFEMPAGAPPAAGTPITQIPPAASDRPEFEAALRMHADSVPARSEGTREGINKAVNIILKHCSGWENFDPSVVWNRYRERKNGKRPPPTSAANHLTCHLRKFVPWCIERGWLSPLAKSSLDGIPRIKVSPRRITPASPEQLGELLAMVESEDLLEGLFLRFIATTGLRRSSAETIEWRAIDFTHDTMIPMLKGQRKDPLTLSPEARACLCRVKALELPGERVFPLDGNRVDRAIRKLKRFAKGLDLELTFPHALRHNFASIALESGLSTKEVAELLGHQDGGILVATTYGHIRPPAFRKKVMELKVVTPPGNPDE